MGTSLPPLTSDERQKFLDILELLSSGEVGIDKKRIALIPLRKTNQDKALIGEIILDPETGWLGTRNAAGQIISKFDSLDIADIVHQNQVDIQTLFGYYNGHNIRLNSIESQMLEYNARLENIMFIIQNMGGNTGGGQSEVRLWNHEFGKVFGGTSVPIINSATPYTRSLTLGTPLTNTEGTFIIFPQTLVTDEGKVGEYGGRIESINNLLFFSSGNMDGLPFSWFITFTDNSKFHTTNYPFLRGTFTIPASAEGSMSVPLMRTLPDNKYVIVTTPAIYTEGKLGEHYVVKHNNRFEIHFTGDADFDIPFNYFLIYTGDQEPNYDKTLFPFHIRSANWISSDQTKIHTFSPDTDTRNYAIIGQIITPTIGDFGDFYCSNKGYGSFTIKRTGSGEADTEVIMFAPTI